MISPDANTIYLRAHEAKEARDERNSDAATALAEKRAKADVCEAETLRVLMNDYEIDPADCLARCFRNLNGACFGDLISINAVTTALHQLRDIMEAQHAKNIFDDCLDEVAEGV